MVRKSSTLSEPASKPRSRLFEQARSFAEEVIESSLVALSARSKSPALSLSMARDGWSLAQQSLAPLTPTATETRALRAKALSLLRSRAIAFDRQVDSSALSAAGLKLWRAVFVDALETFATDLSFGDSCEFLGQEAPLWLINEWRARRAPSESETLAAARQLAALGWTRSLPVICRSEPLLFERLGSEVGPDISLAWLAFDAKGIWRSKSSSLLSAAIDPSVSRALSITSELHRARSQSSELIAMLNRGAPFQADFAHVPARHLALMAALLLREPAQLASFSLKLSQALRSFRGDARIFSSSDALSLLSVARQDERLPSMLGFVSSYVDASSHPDLARSYLMQCKESYPSGKNQLRYASEAQPFILSALRANPAAILGSRFLDFPSPRDAQSIPETLYRLALGARILPDAPEAAWICQCLEACSTAGFDPSVSPQAGEPSALAYLDSLKSAAAKAWRSKLESLALQSYAPAAPMEPSSSLKRPRL